ncbi:MAG: ATPase, partial [Synechococcus sp.]
TPVLCKIRQRLTKHGGETMDVLGLWQGHFQAHRKSDRKAKVALPKARTMPQVVEGLSID